jgi:aspartate carbamoyltransferase catalytic subunit
LKAKDIISIRDLDRVDIEEILFKAREMEDALEGGRLDTMEGKIMASLFFEPSTRTRFSFSSAMYRLGGEVLNLEDVATSSIAKGETMVDTIKMMEGYSDLIVIRHPMEGSARLTSEVSSKPVINGGDGANQHPTQTLLDLYTIKRLKGNIEGLTIALVGDLKYGRVMKTLAYALTMFKARLVLVSPTGLELPQGLVEEIQEKFSPDIKETNDITSGVRDADVVYACRIQKERFKDEYEAEKMQRTFRITPELLAEAKEDMIILHPLPKTREIDPRIDEMEQAKYFQQAHYGIPVRMALISLLIGGEGDWEE